MKIKNLLTSLFLLLAFVNVFAGKVEMSEAQQIATKFYNQKYLVNHPGTTETFFITETYTKWENGEIALYIFNFNNNGFAIVPADDIIYPVVGFSFDGSYQPDAVPENALYVINEFGRQVAHVRENNIEATSEVINAWQNLRSGNTKRLSFLGNNRDIEPMVLAMWNQDWPYNAMCPSASNGPGGHVYAGCVATAMSMIMYHWRYPVQGSGSHSYYAPGYGTLSANFGATNYDYYGMVDASDNTYNEMIALLQYHCGVATDMQYSTSGSGTYSNLVPAAIETYFNYDVSSNIVYRGNMTLWKMYLDQQIEWLQPVYYSGQDNSGGHAFVVDGMQEQADDTYYHFNFGWSGSMNGWYLVTNAGGFNQDNAMVRNFIPDQSSYPYDPPEEQVLLTWFDGTIEDCSGPKADYQNDVSCSWLINPQTEMDSVSSIKITFNRFATESDGDFVRVYDGPDTDSRMLGEYSGSDIPSMITSTNSKVLVTFTTNSSITANGFQLTYKAVRPTWCSGMQTYTEPSGTFGDGSGSFFYNNNQNCMWRITPEYASSATLYFNYFDTEADFDMVKVFDYDTQELLAEFSGDVTPDPVVSPSGQFFITFNTNGNIRGQGWEASYTIGNVGIGDITNFESLRIYPNPVKDLLTVTFTTVPVDEVSLSINTLTGVKVYTETLTNFNGYYNNKLDLSSLAKGIYFLNIRCETGNIVKKIVVE
nr:C10 family peptidase [Bacteroidota bacterium]